MFGFLGQIPGFLAKGAQSVGSGVMRGAQTVGKGILGGARKTTDALMKARGGGGGGGGLDLPNAQMPSPMGVPMTPGINPDAQMPDIGGAMMPKRMPPITGLGGYQPNSAGARSLFDDAPESLHTSDAAMPGLIPQREVPQVRVPQLPGRKGPMLDDTPYNRSRYEYVTRNMTDEGEIPRSWKTIGRSALAGIARTYQQNPNASWQAQLAGGAVGGAGAAINPAGGEEFVFDSMYAPGIEKDQQRAQEAERLENERIRREQDVLMGRARIDDYESRRRAADEERPYRMRDLESQATLNEARAEAARRSPRVSPRYVQGVVDGEPGYYDVNDPAMQGKIKPYERPQRESEEKLDDTWKSLNRDMQAFNKIKAEADEAMRSQYTEEGQAKLAQAKAMAEQMRALYGDLVEIGESNGWPYAKPRQSAPRRGGSRPASGGRSGGTAKLSDLKRLLQ